MSAVQSTVVNDKNTKSSKSAMVFGITCIAVIVSGWLYKNQMYIKAENGLGYTFGIFGCICMLTLLLYPARKKIKFMRHWGPVKPWFTLHMFLGMVGPIIILFHANFKFGSTNSNVAMISMLLIVASGIVGRYLYRKINQDLFKHRRSMLAFQEKIASYRKVIGDNFLNSGYAAKALAKFAKKTGSQNDTSKRSYFYIIFVLPLYVKWVRWCAIRSVRRELIYYKTQHGWTKSQFAKINYKVIRTINSYLDVIVNESEYLVYQRLFSWWHVIHLPLFFIAVISAVFHVVAVHIY